jgi:hypothetical protein
MPKSHPVAAEPSPGQFLGKQGKKRSWKKGILWDPSRQSLEIRKLNDPGMLQLFSVV